MTIHKHKSDSKLLRNIYAMREMQKHGLISGKKVLTE